MKWTDELRARHARIESFEIDDPSATFRYRDKLAHENGWSPAFAARVIAEYRRFAFLAVAAGHPVSPSDTIDQAWHLHMLYSRNYWERFCPEALGRPFHHEPSRGGPDEGARHVEQYRRTLESYRAWFGEEPPADVWPAVPFEGAWRRVDLRRNWIVPRFRRGMLASPGLALLLALGFAPALGESNVLGMRGPDFLAYYIPALGLSVALALVVRVVLTAPGGSSRGPSRHSPEEIATLAGGRELAVEATLAGLAEDGAIELGRNARRRAVARSAGDFSGLGGYPAAVARAVRAYPDGADRKEIAEATRGELEEIEERLASEELILSPSRRRLTRLVPPAVLAPVLLVGAAKFLVGIANDRPVGFLTVLLLGGTIVGIFLLAAPAWRTRRGERLLAGLRRAERLTRKASRRTEVESGLELAHLTALFGTSALTTAAVSPLAADPYRPQAYSSTYGPGGGCGTACGGSAGGSSCGSSCGGGGCGGGCGGCGGS